MIKDFIDFDFYMWGKKIPCKIKFLVYNGSVNRTKERKQDMILFLFVCIGVVGLCVSIEIDERKEKYLAK